MPDFGIFRGFNEKLFGDKLYAGQLPINLGLIGSEDVSPPPVFEFSVKTNNTGVSTSTQFRMPLTTSTGLNFDVDWGDGSFIENITNHTLAIHTYSSAGTYTIKVTGSILGWQFANGGDKLKMLNVVSWGALIISVNQGFHGCSNLTCSAIDAPTITTTTLENYFRSCLIFNGEIGNWNVSNVTSMAAMFRQASAFNKYIGNWNTSSVTNMVGMFAQDADSFNQNIATKTVNAGLPNEYVAWDVSNVTSMVNMFNGADNFDQNIGNWNIINVVDFTFFMANRNNLNYSAANLDSIYNGWSSLPSVKPNLSISFGSIKYTAASAAGRLILTSAPNNWTITDGGI
jgi:surface protein